MSLHFQIYLFIYFLIRTTFNLVLPPLTVVCVFL